MSDEIVIRKVKNGWEVLPFNPREGCVVMWADTLVFNDMGGAYSMRDGMSTDDTLLGWIASNMRIEGKE